MLMELTRIKKRQFPTTITRNEPTSDEVANGHGTQPNDTKTNSYGKKCRINHSQNDETVTSEPLKRTSAEKEIYRKSRLRILQYPFGGGGNFDIHKKPSKRIDLLLFSKLDVPSNVVQKKRVAQLHFFKIRPSQEILKIRDATPLEAEGILTYIKSPRNGSICYFYRKLDVPSNYKLDVPSNIVQKKRVARIMFFKIRPSQEILKIRDGTPLEAEGILTYIKRPRNGSICYFSSKLDVPSNVVHNKRVAQILFFKIRASQEILKIRDGTPLEAEGIVTYIKSPRNGSICYFSSKLDVPSN
ncbi:hypothetical protein OROMI_024944 [Orobanche minor]